MELIKIINKGDFEKKMSNEVNEIFENLEEGILLIKNNSINFANKMFHQILQNMSIISSNGDNIEEGVLDYKMFRLFRNIQFSDTSESSISDCKGSRRSLKVSKKRKKKDT